VAVGSGHAVAVPLRPPVRVVDALAVPVAVAPREGDARGEEEGVPEARPALADALGEGEGEGGAGVGVGGGVGVGVAHALRVLVGGAEAVPAERVPEGLPVPLPLPLAVLAREGAGETLPAPDVVGGPLALSVAVGGGDAEPPPPPPPVALPEPLGDLLPGAEEVMVAVADCARLRPALFELERVGEGAAVSVAGAVPLALALGEREAEGEAEREGSAGEGVRRPVGEAVRVETVALQDGLGESVGALEGAGERLAPPVAVGEGATDAPLE